MSIVSSIRSARRENRDIDAYNDQRVAELSALAQHIKSGNEVPDDWDTFRKKNEQVINASPRRGVLIGAAMGAVVGFAVVGLVSLAIGLGAESAGIIGRLGLGGSVVGALMGWDSEITKENNANTRLVNHYKAYLEDFALAHKLTLQQESAQGIEYSNDHAKKIQQEREKTATTQREV